MSVLWEVPHGIAHAWAVECDVIATLSDISKIRKSPIVENVFDHVNVEYANIYLNFAKKHLPPNIFTACICILSHWDIETGGCLALEVGDQRISFTSSQYVALVAKLYYAFGGIPERIVEIGAGLGGFAYVMIKLGCNIIVVDLPASVRALTNIFKILKTPEVLCVEANNKHVLNELAPGFVVISEHAWSECPQAIRLAYGRIVVFTCVWWLVNLQRNYGGFIVAN